MDRWTRISTVLTGIALAFSVAQATAATFDATFPGNGFSLPTTLGTFNYSLPPGSVVRQVRLGSPLYSFQAAPAHFTLCFTSPPPVLGGCATFTPSDTEFFLGSILLVDPPTTAFPLSGSIPVTVSCLAGPCPASYNRIGGDANWTLGIIYDPPPTTTALDSSLNPSFFGQLVTLTVTVTGSSPTGVVQFKDAGNDLGPPIALSGGTAQLFTSALAVGAHPITAMYSGDLNNLDSTSNTISQVVNLAPASVEPVPTLGEWGLSLTALVLVVAGVITQHRRRRRA